MGDELKNVLVLVAVQTAKQEIVVVPPEGIFSVPVVPVITTFPEEVYRDEVTGEALVEDGVLDTEYLFSS